MGEILEQFGFVEEKYSEGDLYGTGDEIISHQWSAHTNGGSLQYIPHENNLYIWSGRVRVVECTMFPPTPLKGRTQSMVMR